jgi:hypothetical protein
MTRTVVTALIVAVAGGIGPSAQTGSSVPRTPWGHPDLQGRWTNATVTLLERPVELGAKEYFTAEEAAEYSKTALERFLKGIDFTEEAAISGEFAPGVWVEERSIVPTRRTSLIVGPTGRIPALTASAKARADARNAEREQDGGDGPEARPLNERCLIFPSSGTVLLPSIAYNSNLQIVQTATHVVISSEMGLAARVIPLDGRPHLPDAVRRWQGDSRGRFEGDTLVVETTNFNDKLRFRGSSQHLRVIERFRRTDADTIVYEFTASDPTTWTDAWTAEVPMRRLDGLIYEFACHEGNRGLANILSGARAVEKLETGSR